MFFFFCFCNTMDVDQSQLNHKWQYEPIHSKVSALTRQGLHFVTNMSSSSPIYTPGYILKSASVFFVLF